MTYHEAHIAPLSPKQISRLLNSHPVRIKHGSHHKIHLSAEHHKKLHKAGLKGSALTVQLDPFAIAQNQHLRNDVKGLVKGLGMHHMHHLHGRGGTGHQLGNYIVTQGIEPLITASADRGVQALAGSGVRRGRPRKHPMTHGGKVSFQQGLQNFRDTTKSVGQVFLPLNRGAMGQAKRQIVTAGAQGASNKLNPNSYNPSGPSAGDTRRMNRSSRPLPPPSYGPASTLPHMQIPTLEYSPQVQDMYPEPVYAEPIETYPQYLSASPYAIPSGKMYASGLKKHRVKRTMTESQKEALAKGRHALRIKLNEMGAGVKHRKHRKMHGKALIPAGY